MSPGSGDRPAGRGALPRVHDNTTCCYAVQDKVWVTGPGKEPWEVYTVKDDARPDIEGETNLDLSQVAGERSTSVRKPNPAPTTPRSSDTTKTPPCEPWLALTEAGRM